MFTKDQKSQLKNLLKEFGLSGPETDRLLSYPNHPVNRIIITFSLLDISAPEREIYKKATEHKFFLYLYAIKHIFDVAKMPMPNIELLFVDELQKHNLHSIENRTPGNATRLLDGLIEQRLTDWGKHIVKIPDLVSIRNQTGDRTRKLAYTVTNDNDEPVTITQTVRLSSWRDYLTDEIQATVNGLKEKLYAIARQADAIDILADDTLLFDAPNAPLREFKQALLQTIRQSTLYSDQDDHPELDSICEKATYSAAHYLKKAGRLDAELHKVTPLALAKDKKAIIQAFPDQGIKHFIESLLYIIEETLVLNHMLAQQPLDQNLARDTGIHMLYGSGVVEIPSCHPMFVYGRLCQLSELNRSILTFASFNQFYQGLTPAKLAIIERQHAAANETSFQQDSGDSSQSSNSSNDRRGGNDVLTLQPDNDKAPRGRSTSNAQQIPSPTSSDSGDEGFSDFLVAALMQETKTLFKTNPALASVIWVKGLKAAATADLDSRSNHSDDEEDVKKIPKKRRGTQSGSSSAASSPTDESPLSQMSQASERTHTLETVFSLRPARTASKSPTSSQGSSPATSPTPPQKSPRNSIG